MKFVAVFAVAVIVLMIGQWMFFLISGQVPELETAPIEIAFHLVAELAAAAALVIGGSGLLSSRRWGWALTLVALGMLIYTTINSPGYFAQWGEWSLAAMFAVLLVLAIVSAVAHARSAAGSPSSR